MHNEIQKFHHLTEFLVRHIHEGDSHHSGRDYIMAAIRQRFWIPCRLMKKVVRNCVLCRCLKERLEVQRMADVPVNRINPQDDLSRTLEWTFFGRFCFVFVKREEVRLPVYLYDHGSDSS